MNRRGLFGALLGGVAAVTGLRSLAGAHLLAPGSRILLRKTASMGKTEQVLQQIGDALDLPGAAPWRTASAPTCEVLALFESDVPREAEQALNAVEAPPTAPVDLPTVWPGFSGEITATASLPPLIQVERLIELFGQSGRAAPSFAAALVGELVLTRMRLASADPRTLMSLRADLP